MSLAHNQLRIAHSLWQRLQPLDRTCPARLQGLLADRRFGSRDRRLYRELLLTAQRHARLLAAIDDEATWAALLARTCAATRETEGFRATFGGSASTPPAIQPLALMPEWFAEECETGASPEATAAALLARAPVWVRLQTDDPEEVFAEWASRGWSAERHPELADAYKLPAETNVASCQTYEAGRYEIQDAGSQRILASLDLPAASPGPHWLDACAGAGGKTLQLARLLGPAARIDATDIRPGPLAELRTRAMRAGLSSRIRTLAPGAVAGTYDGVLVDAPCSGSGTWRRAPHLMACTTRADLAAATQIQQTLLGEAAARVRPGGLLVYATCSIARTENRLVAEAFLAPHSSTFAPAAPAVSIAPGLEDNDGFFTATFRRNTPGPTANRI